MASNISGSGILEANGGSVPGTSGRGGGGSGGRVAVIAQELLGMKSKQLRAYGGSSTLNINEDRPGSGGTVHEHSSSQDSVRSSIDGMSGGYLVTEGVQLEQEPSPDFRQTITVTSGSQVRFRSIPEGVPLPSRGFTTLMYVNPYVYVTTGDASTQPVSVMSDHFESGTTGNKLQRLVYKIAQLHVLVGGRVDFGMNTTFENIHVNIEGSLSGVENLIVGKGATLKLSSLATTGANVKYKTNEFHFRTVTVKDGGTLVMASGATFIVTGTLTVGDQAIAMEGATQPLKSSFIVEGNG